LDIRLFLQKVADAHYAFGDYTEAVSLLKEALAVKGLPPVFQLLLYGNNTLGLCYQQLKELDSSDTYFRKAYAFAATGSFHNEDWKAIASGNLGANLFLRGDYIAAIPLLQLDVDMSVKRKDWACASGSQTTIADIRLKQDNLAAAAEALANARQYAYHSGEYKRLKPLYPLLSKYYTAIGNAKLAGLYLDSSFFVNDSLQRAYDGMKLLKAQQKIDIERQNATLAEIKSQKKIKTIERNAFAVFIVLLGIGSVYVHRNQRKKNLQKQQLLNLQLNEKETALNLAASQLEGFAHNISEKNKLLEALQQQFGENSDNQVLNQLQQSTILTDEEWDKFRGLFEKVHGGYLQRLKEKLPELSPAETRFMTLAKLQLSNKEMAATLGVSNQAIRTTWYRLRKKEASQ